MAVVKDPAIKLFGKTIHLSHLDDEQQHNCSGDFKKSMEQEHEDDTNTDQSTSLTINDDPKTPTPDKETPSKNTQKNKNPVDNSSPEDKPQKPDKILPCPRCNSTATKFCYYNNYNVNQPRHFCKNCQRYWTAGGTMRHTPVGSGRRKNKSLSSASYYRHLIITDTCLKKNGSVLNFGSDGPLCESMNQARNFSDKSQKLEDDSSSSASSLFGNGGKNRNLGNLPNVQIPCFSSHPQTSAQLQSPANVYHSGFLVNFYPTPHYWLHQMPMPMPMQMPLMNSNSPLGKHSRDGNLVLSSSDSGNKESLKDKYSESLITNDPNKAAKNAIRTGMEISEGKNLNWINGGITSKAFQSNPA